MIDIGHLPGHRFDIAFSFNTSIAFIALLAYPSGIITRTERIIAYAYAIPQIKASIALLTLLSSTIKLITGFRNIFTDSISQIKTIGTFATDGAIILKAINIISSSKDHLVC